MGGLSLSPRLAKNANGPLLVFDVGGGQREKQQQITTGLYLSGIPMFMQREIAWWEARKFLTHFYHLDQVVKKGMFYNESH